MNDIKNIFKRYEIKYRISESQRARIEQAMKEYMVPDEFGESTICNIYFDTPDSRIIRRSLEGPVYKEKLRLRSYGTAKPGDMIFCELKKKYKDVVYKRRLILPDKDAEEYMKAGRFDISNSQIGREIERFGIFYEKLSPAMYISYDRSAFFSPEDPNLRITFDRNILWRDTDLTLTSPPYGLPLTEYGTSLMEIKTSLAIPLWLSHLLAENDIFKTSFSKYGSAYVTSMEQDMAIKEGGYCCA